MKLRSSSVIKFFLLLLGIFVTNYIYAGCQQKEGNKQIKVMSYNIRYTYGMDEKYDIERIAEVIKKQQPDVVGLQEIGDSAMAAKLGELTQMSFVFGPSKENNKGYGDAILCKFPFEYLGNFHIPSASSSRYQVMGVDIDLSTKYGEGLKVRFLNTHFDWLSSIGSQEARLATVNVIERGFMEDISFPAILTGDLNATPDSAPIKKLEQKGWVNKKGGSELFTIPVEKPKKQIDYILIRPRKAWKIINTRVIPEKVASDHLPVVMTLQLIEQTAGKENVKPVPGTLDKAAPAGWSNGGNWMDQHNDICAIGTKQKVDLVFIGNSITQSWSNNNRNVWSVGQETWDKYYKPRNGANFGISGDKVENILWRIENGNFKHCDPKLVVVLAGTNNIEKSSEDFIVRGIEEIVKSLRVNAPNAKVLLLGILPRGEFSYGPFRKKIIDINSQIKHHADNKKVFYMDMGKHFLLPNGEANSDYFRPDYLHLNEAGYKLWAATIEPFVSDIFK